MWHFKRNCKKTRQENGRGQLIPINYKAKQNFLANKRAEFSSTILSLNLIDGYQTLQNRWLCFGAPVHKPIMPTRA